MNALSSFKLLNSNPDSRAKKTNIFFAINHLTEITVRKYKLKEIKLRSLDSFSFIYVDSTLSPLPFEYRSRRIQEKKHIWLLGNGVMLTCR